MTGASRVCRSLVLIGLEGPEIQGKTILKLDWRDLRSPKKMMDISGTSDRITERVGRVSRVTRDEANKVWRARIKEEMIEESKIY